MPKPAQSGTSLSTLQDSFERAKERVFERSLPCTSKQCPLALGWSGKLPWRTRRKEVLDLVDCRSQSWPTDALYE
jgi:hypothetical protein